MSSPDDAEAELNHLRRALALRDQLVDLAAHDLRNPLHSLSIALAELDNPELPAAERKQFAAAARRSVVKLEALVNDFVEMNHLDSGRLQVDVQTVPVAPLLEQVRGDHKALSDQAGMAIDLAIEGGDALAIRGDRERIRQAIGKLVINALRHGRGAGPVELRAARSGDKVEISVADRGVGFSEAMLREPFDRLGEAARARRHKGLGLPLAHGLVRAMGGSIAVANRDGGGAEVRVSLPAA